MLKHFMAIATVVLSLVLPSLAASGNQEDVSRINASARVLHEVMNAPDDSIPQDLLDSAKCIAIIPGDKKAAFIFGGSYGKGVATCRTPQGWSAPVFLMIGGGSWGFQIGGSSTDIVMIVKSEHGMQSLLSDKFKLGADVSAAAGPVGRSAAVSTDLKLNAEILTYSRSKGAFAGISLDGAVVKTDQGADQAMYGPNVDRQQVLNGSVPIPPAAQPLIAEIGQYTNSRAAENAGAR